MEKLSQIAVCYKTLEELLQMLEFGVESDLKRCGDKQYTAEGCHFDDTPRFQRSGVPGSAPLWGRKGRIPLESEYYETDWEEERRLLYVGMTRAKEELVLTSTGETSPFLADIPEHRITKETAGPKKAAGDMASDESV